MAEIRTVAETRSTNDDLAARARDGAPEGLWLRAERQWGGKGRQGRAWQSLRGNLHASTLVRLRPDDPPAPTLALVAAVALHETVAPLAPEVRIKWPNDLLLRVPAKARTQSGGATGLPLSREHAAWAKVAGILLERHGEAVIVGFGVNLAHHPEGLERPTADLGGAEPPAAFLARLAAAFAGWLGRWRVEGLAPVRSAWLGAAHPLGTSLAIDDAQGNFDGLEESGALRLRLEDGSLRVVHAGDVFLL